MIEWNGMKGEEYTSLINKHKQSTQNVPSKAAFVGAKIARPVTISTPTLRVYLDHSFCFHLMVSLICSRKGGNNHFLDEVSHAPPPPIGTVSSSRASTSLPGEVTIDVNNDSSGLSVSCLNVVNPVEQIKRAFIHC